MYASDKPRSLVEQKKLQWAKEREELAKLSVPWGKNQLHNSNDKFISIRRSSQTEYYTNQNLPAIVPKKQTEYDRYEIEGDTSGYASESNKDSSPDQMENREIEVWTSSWQRHSDSDNSTGREDRPKWGDRGLAVGHLWEPREENKVGEPPGWMQRGLRRDKEILVVSQSPEQSDLERPFTSDSNLTNNTSRTHLRGQNIPLDPNEVIERERKRKKALELQTAIKQQLEEKELKKKQERERKLREEAEEEDRIRKEQELERKRVEEEERIIQEKKEREKQRAKAMQEALENAEKEAKEKKKSNKKVAPKKESEENAIPPIGPPKLQHSPVHRPIIPQPEAPPKSPKNSPTATPKIRTPVKSPKAPKSPKVEVTKKQDVPMKLQNMENMDNYALVLPNTFDNMQNMQFALLVPNLSLGDSQIALTDRSFLTENRVLTPSIYRNKKILRESSTQTDSDLRYGTDSGSLDRGRNRNKNREKIRELKRFRSEDRKENRDRPKWGANRPPTRYMKQSEKDPFYQKRKLRQKTREIQFIYEDNNNNNYSEVSTENSCPTTPEKSYSSGNRRSKWHKNERMFAQNISVYQTEILPLEFDRQGRVYLKEQDFEAERYRKTREVERSNRQPRYYDRRKMSECRYDESGDERSENEVLEKLNSLHEGLMLKKRQWDNKSGRNPSGRTTTFPNL